MPTPGGPQKMSEPVSSRSICTRSDLPGPEDMLLPDKLVERARTHAIRERPGLVDGFVVCRIVIEEGQLLVAPLRLSEAFL